MEMEGNTQAYYNSALKLKLPVELCPPIQGIKLTFGKKNYYIFNIYTPINSTSSYMIASNKFALNYILNKANIPVPKSKVVSAQDYRIDKLITLTADLKFPVVLKPMLYSNKGTDVTCNIPNLPALHKLCESYLKQYQHMVIEEFHANAAEFRILVFKNKILDVIERIPAQVVGNGKNTIFELAEIENAKREKIRDFLWPIKFDDDANLCLEKQGLTKESIPQEGKIVKLHHVCNTSRGGMIKSVPTKMCKQNKALFLKAARTLNLTLAGIDVICKSLDEPLELSGGVILEANANPSMRIHEEGVGGKQNMVSMIILRSFIYKHPFYYLRHRLMSLLRNLL